MLDPLIVQIDLDAETAALRQKSAYSSPTIWMIAFMALLFFTIIAAILLLGNPPKDEAIPLWAAWAFAGSILLFAGAIIYALARKARRLIDSGVIVVGYVHSVIPLLGGQRRVTLRYDFGGVEHKSPFYADKFIMIVINSAPCVLTVVLPEHPEVASPLYQFGGWRESFQIAAGNRGLVDNAKVDEDEHGAFPKFLR